MSWFSAPPRRRRTKKSRGKSAYRKGKIGETKALGYLTRRGYKPLAQRIRAKGETDLLVRHPKGGQVSIEVKNLSKPVPAAMVEKFGKKFQKQKKMGLVRKGMFISKSGYSDEAKKTARKYRVKLLDYKPPKRRKKLNVFGF